MARHHKATRHHPPRTNAQLLKESRARKILRGECLWCPRPALPEESLCTRCTALQEAPARRLPRLAAARRRSAARRERSTLARARARLATLPPWAHVAPHAPAGTPAPTQKHRRNETISR